MFGVKPASAMSYRRQLLVISKWKSHKKVQMQENIAMNSEESGGGCILKID